MKRILEFMEFSKKPDYIILSVDWGFEKTDPNYGFIETWVELDGVKKLLSIEQDIFITFIKEIQDNKLGEYLDSRGISDIDDVFNELKEFNWDFSKSLIEYINSAYDPKTFNELEDYSDSDEDTFGDYDDDEGDGDILN